MDFIKACERHRGGRSASRTTNPGLEQRTKNLGAVAGREPDEVNASFRGNIFETGLKAIADAGLGHQKARVIGIGFDLLPQLANENS